VRKVATKDNPAVEYTIPGKRSRRARYARLDALREEAKGRAEGDAGASPSGRRSRSSGTTSAPADGEVGGGA
jgi:hypothetical protein